VDKKCKTEALEAGKSGQWGHLQIPEGPTLNTFESEGNTVLKATTGGVTITLTSSSLEGSGEIENATGGEIKGTGTITYLGVAANHSCLVNGSATSSITTKLLKETGVSTTELKFEPNSGSTIAEFTLSSCAISALNKTWVISGVVVGTFNGAEVEFSHAGTTTQGTLKANTSIAAGLEGGLLIVGANGNLLAVT